MTVKKIIILFLFFSPNIFYAQVLEADSLALVSFYNEMGGDKWTNNTNWLKGKVSTWYGISLDGTRVSAINLFDNNLKGQIPSALVNLSKLSEISMGRDSIYGTIPSTFGNLKELYSLSIIQTALTGEIPASIGDCAILFFLRLSQNGLTGTIPSSFSKLTKLGWLQFSNNKLSGNFPAVVTSLKALWTLELDNNNFTGNIPSEINTLTNLRNLSLNNNRFNGTVPSIHSLINLESLSLAFNQLKGDNMSFLNSHPEIKFLDLSNNMFTGIIKISGLNPTKVVRSNYSTNLFTGMDNFSNFVNKTNLSTIFVTNNQLDFDDLIPNAGLLPGSKLWWDPQSPAAKDTLIISSLGSNLVLNSTMTSPSVSYQWYFNNLEIQGATKAQYTITTLNANQYGKYRYRAFHPAFTGDNSSYMSSSVFQIASSISTSLETLNEKLYSIWYEPRFGKLEIELDQTVQGKYISILLPSGQLISKETIYQQSYSGYVSSAISGLFMILVETDKGILINKYFKN